MPHHLIAVNRLQEQLGHSVTPKEATVFLMIVIAAVLIFVIKRIVF